MTLLNVHYSYNLGNLFGGTRNLKMKADRFNVKVVNINMHIWKKKKNNCWLALPGCTTE